MPKYENSTRHFYGPSLCMEHNKREITEDNPYQWHQGSYWHRNGAVKFYGDNGMGNREPYTCIEVYTNGKVYSRVYRKFFSNHGLMLICARFAKDVEKLIKQP